MSCAHIWIAIFCNHTETFVLFLRWVTVYVSMINSRILLKRIIFKKKISLKRSSVPSGINFLGFHWSSNRSSQCSFQSRPPSPGGRSSAFLEQNTLKKPAKLLNLSKRGRSSEILEWTLQSYLFLVFLLAKMARAYQRCVRYALELTIVRGGWIQLNCLFCAFCFAALSPTNKPFESAET